ncbi:MAG: hypothetical protein LC687_00065 [Actinobacteria bacterium]|nr:hypothetical protein [Actinomycetota bacterium]
MMNNTKEAEYQALVREAKKLRSAARRAEAKGDFLSAEDLRAQVEGLRWEMLHMREHWS